jgi:hypothetical protein
MRRRRNDDETMGTAESAGRIRRRRDRVVGLIGVGDKGSQGGASGGRVEGELRAKLIIELGSPCLLWQHDVCGSTLNISY